MTEDQKRIKIAEACGWKSQTIGPSWHQSETKMPDYFNDLNAMHEAEKVLSNEQWADYIMAFGKIFAQDVSTHYWSLARSLIRATAAQRAEAFGRVKGLWE